MTVEYVLLLVTGLAFGSGAGIEAIDRGNLFLSKIQVMIIMQICPFIYVLKN